MAGSPLPASAPTDLDVHPRPFLWPWWRGAASYPPPAPCRHAAPGGSPSRPRGCLRLWLRRIAGGSSSGRKPCGARVRPVPRIRASCRSARQWLSKCPRPRPLFPNWAAAIKPGLVVLIVLVFRLSNHVRSLNKFRACGPRESEVHTRPERGPSVASVSFERQPRWAPLDGLSENSVRHHPTQQPNAAAVRRRERRGCRATHEGEPSCRATSLEIEPEPRTTLPPNG